MRCELELRKDPKILAENTESTGSGWVGDSKMALT